MDKDQSLALHDQGKDAWNKWAEWMLAKKERLQNIGKWESSKASWEEKAKVDFGGHIFEGSASFAEFIFPGETEIKQATFLCSVSFFAARFSDIASFRETTFVGGAKFVEAVFHGSSSFDGANFYGKTHFNGATFSSASGFGKSKFIADPRTSHADPHTAFFSAIVCERYFNLDGAHFEKVPDFAQAHFLEAPSLDRIVIGPEARENPTPPTSQSPSPLRGGIKGGG